MVIELDNQFNNLKEQIESVIQSVVSKHQIVVSQTTIDNLVIHLSLCITRELNGTYIPTSESQMNYFKDHEYYPIACELVEQLNQLFNIDIDKNQINYTTMYLANMNLLDIDFNIEFDLCDDEMENVMSETITKIKNDLQIDLRENKDFYTGMTLHFYPAIERLQNNNQLTDNPLKDKIQSQHQKEYQCAIIFNEVVDNHYHKQFNEHELAYIALHFGTVMTKSYQ